MLGDDESELTLEAYPLRSALLTSFDPAVKPENIVARQRMLRADFLVYRKEGSYAPTGHSRRKSRRMTPWSPIGQRLPESEDARKTILIDPGARTDRASIVTLPWALWAGHWKSESHGKRRRDLREHLELQASSHGVRGDAACF